MRIAALLIGLGAATAFAEGTPSERTDLTRPYERAAQQYYRVTLKLQDPLGGHINDFDRWMIMAPRFLHDRVDYVDDQFPTPPLSLLAIAPFTALSRPADSSTAVVIWDVVIGIWDLR